MQLIRRSGLLLLLLPLAASAAVLPEDRADLMYHYYDGGGATIDGPALLVRKKFAEKSAVSASYYVDMVSSASIDVITIASEYREERAQYGVGFEYLRGSDDVTRRGDAVFADSIDRRVYGVAVSQVATRNLVLGFTFETIAEEGYLSSPYRAAVQADYRFYNDTWEIRSHTAGLSCTHPLNDRWTLDVRYRYHDQDSVEFYSDLYPREDFQNFLARDKELSTMQSHTVGFGVAYELRPSRLSFSAGRR